MKQELPVKGNELNEKIKKEHKSISNYKMSNIF